MSSASENLLLDKLLPNKETIYGIAFYGMSTLDSYTVLDKLGEGTFGTVTKCVLKERRSKLAMPSSASSSASLLSLRTSGISDKPGRLVALKRVIIHDLKEGFPITALREVTILKQLRHKNILPLLDIAHERDAKLSNDKREHANFFLVSPYMKSDLSGLLNNPDIKFNEAIMKCFLKQLLEGLNYLHHKKYYHRDIKTANLLVDHNGVLKIADFGLARKYYGHAPLPQGGPSEVRAKYTGLVVTRWYRAPELLLGDRKYTTAIDMWGVGCIFGELFETRPIIMGKTDLDQLIQIFQLLGEPNDQNYPEFRNLPNPLNAAITHYNPTLKLRFEGYFETSDSRTHGMDLLSKLLHLNPMTRYNAEQALKHRYFSSLPYPLEHYQLPKFMESHEMDNKRFKMEKARREKLQQTPNFSSAQRRLFPENAGNRYNSGNHGYNKLHRARLNGVNNSYDSDLRYEDTLKKAPVGNTSWTKQRSNNTAYEQKESRRKLWDAANHVRDNSPAPPWESKDNSSMLEMLGLALKKLKPQQESANSVSAISELNVEVPKKAITAHDVPVKSSRSQDESKQSAGLHKPRSNEPLKPRVSKPTSSVLFARQTSRPGSSKTAVQKPSLVSILNKMKDKGSDLISISQDKPERAKPLRSIKDEVGLTSRPKKDISSSTLTDPENVSKSSIFSKAVDETKTSHSAEISTIENSATKNSSQKPLSIENNTDNNIEASPTTQRPTSPRRLRSSRRLRHEQPSSPSDSGNAEDDAKEKSRDSEVSSASVDSATKRKALFSGPGRNKKRTKP